MTVWPPTIWKAQFPVCPTLHYLHNYNNNTHVGIALHNLAQSVFQEKYTHQISTLATTPESGKQEHLKSYYKALIPTTGAETLGDPYHKKVPIPSITAYRAREANT